MKYLVITKTHSSDDCLLNFSIIAETTTEDIAKHLIEQLRKKNPDVNAEIHAVMEDSDVIAYLNTYKVDSDNSKDTFNKCVRWLKTSTFVEDYMNDIAYEIGCDMDAVYVHGCEYYDWELEDYVNFTVNRDNPDVKETLDFCINTIKQDIDLLEELGITTKSKPTKKCPHTINDIDWSAFDYFKR